MSQSITLMSNNGKEFIIDAEDHIKIKDYHWYLGTTGYMVAVVKLHKLIMNGVDGDGQTIDHVNMNKFDNRKCNLRRITKMENSCNRTIGSSNRSGYKGVSYVTRRGVWKADIKVNGYSRCIGYYKEPKIAALCYDTYVEEVVRPMGYIHYPTNKELGLLR